MSAPYQIEMSLAPRAADEILAERLADRLEQFNASADPLERVELHQEIRRMRAQLASYSAPKGGRLERAT
jgi:hypothetical protein